MRFRLLAAVAVLAIVAAACTDSADTTATTEGAPEPTTTTEGAPEPTTTTEGAPEPTTTTQAAPEPTTATTDAPDDTPSEQAELRLAISFLGNEALDPIFAPGNAVPHLTLIFDSLVGVDQAGQEFSKETGIASDWQVSDDGLTFTFQLREGVKFHNGDDVTAEDVKFTLERLADPEASCFSCAQIARNLESVTVNGPSEVEVKLLAPDLSFLTNMSPLDQNAGFIVPKNYIEQVGAEAFAESPVGSGPYTLANRQVGVSIELERADGQHFAITPRFERVTLSVVPEETTRIAMLQTGEADFIDVSIDKVPPLTGDGFSAFAHGLGDPLWLFFQIQREGEATIDDNLREALSLAINRVEINEALMGGLGDVSGNVFAGIGADPIPAPVYDPDLAEQALALSAFGPGGESINIQLQAMPRGGWNMLGIAEAIQGYWAKVGVNSTIIYRDFGSTRGDWIAGTLPPPAAMMLNLGSGQFWHPKAVAVACTGAVAIHCDTEVNDLTAAWAVAPTLAEYAALAASTEQAIVAKYIILPIVTARQHYVASDVVRDDYNVGNPNTVWNMRGLVWG